MKILFQGDSITDVGRPRDHDFFMGSGYATLVSAHLGFEEPGKYEFVNRGVSGNRIVDVYARMKVDILNLKPDIMSILIGVNDVWHEFSYQNGVDAEKFYKVYAMLIEEVKAALPDIKIMILEPFALKARATEEHWEEFRSETEKRAAMAKKIADTYNLPFIPLQKGFDELAAKVTPDYWLFDGVHPSPMGHEYIKTQWLKAFKAL